LIAQGIGDEREADTGIARGAFDDQSAGPQIPARDRVVNDGEPGTVLHRSARVHELRLAQDRAAGQLRRMAQCDERGSPNRFDDIGRNAHFSQRSSPGLSKIYVLPERSVEHWDNPAAKREGIFARQQTHEIFLEESRDAMDFYAWRRCK